MWEGTEGGRLGGQVMALQFEKVRVRERYSYGGVNCGKWAKHGKIGKISEIKKNWKN